MQLEAECRKRFNLPNQKSAGSDGVYDVVKPPKNDADTMQHPRRAGTPINRSIAARNETADQPSAYKHRQSDRETNRDWHSPRQYRTVFVF